MNLQLSSPDSTMVLYASAGAVLVGLGAALVLALGRRRSAGVARSLALIDELVPAQARARNARPASERASSGLYAVARVVGERLSPSGTAARLAHQLDLAGNPAAWTVERLMAAKGAAFLVLALLGLAVGGGVTGNGMLFALAFGAGGLFLPDLLTYNNGVKRQEQLGRGLADALDMLTVCVEAGQGFDAAFLQVARSTNAPIGREFARVLQEIQIGKGRGEAFSALAARTTVTEVKTFVTALVQADRLGLPIAGVLREQTAHMRQVRRQKAEEKAQKVTVKILFPLIFCIFPVLMVVVMGPGMVRLVHVFAGM